MVSDIKIDFALMKFALTKIIDENTALFSRDENYILQFLYEKSDLKINFDTENLKQYKGIFVNSFAKKCKEIAEYCSKVDIHNIHGISNMHNKDELFKSGIFSTFIRHLYLENELLNANNETSISIITTLFAHLGSLYYFKADSETLEKLFFYSLLLYLSETKCFDHEDVEAKSVVKSMKNLLNIQGLEFEIKHGDVYLDESSEYIVHSEIEKHIKAVGGIEFLRLLFNKEITPKYNKAIDRFMLHRNMEQLLTRINRLRIPYNYLMQMAVKHLCEVKCPLLTEKGRNANYDNAIRISSDYLNVLNLQSYSILSDIFWNYENIPKKLSQNTLFEKMHTPIQYRCDFVVRFMKDVYGPLFSNSKIREYSFKEYFNFCNVILNESRVCVTYTFDELKKTTKIKHTVLMKILNDVSIPYDEVNSGYNHFLSKTNYKSYPLIKLKNNTYFLFSAHFNSFAFCEVLYKKLNPYFRGQFNKLKGEYFETMIKNLFIDKGFSFHSGKYQEGNSNILECDMILEDDKQIVFLEIKNQPLFDSFETGDDVETLYCIGEGMVKAQKQCYRHIRQLKRTDKLVIEDNEIQYELVGNSRKIICISVCSQEYFFLTNKTFSEAFLNSLLSVTYHATDPNKKTRLNNLNTLCNQLKQLVADIGDDQVFFNTLFRSAQQIFTTLSVSKTLDDFIYYLTQPIYLSDNSADAYNQLLTGMKMKRINLS